MFKHNMRNDLPSIDSNSTSTLDKLVNKRDADRKLCIKVKMDARRRAKVMDFVVGEKVLLKDLHKQNKLSTEYEPHPYTITKVYRSSVKIENTSGNTYIRNKSHLKKFLQSNTDLEDPPTDPIPEVVAVAPQMRWLIIGEEDIIEDDILEEDIVNNTDDEDVEDVRQRLAEVQINIAFNPPEPIIEINDFDEPVDEYIDAEVGRIRHHRRNPIRNRRIPPYLRDYSR